MLYLNNQTAVTNSY